MVRLLKKVSLVVGTMRFWKLGLGDLPLLIAAFMRELGSKDVTV